MQQTTAIQWLIDNLEKYEDYAKISWRCLGEIEIALEMEKEQIKDAYGDGLNAYRTEFCNRDEYFNKTFKQDL